MTKEYKTPGDTYEAYQQRCAAKHIRPEPFIAWLTFELAQDPKRLRGDNPIYFEEACQS